MSQPTKGIIALFCQHRVAANLLMLIVILSGVLALSKLNTQFFPNFELDVITVRVVWGGASAEDVETAVTNPLEQELRSVDNLHKISSTSATGVSVITLEYDEHTNMDAALEVVNGVLSRVRQLPENAEDPIVNRVIRFETIARLLVTGPSNLDELRHLTHRIKDDLLARGISKITITGLPKQQIAIQIPAQQLLDLGLTLDEIAKKIQVQSKDVPSGSVGQNDIARLLRGLDQRRNVIDFENLPITINNNGKIIHLGSIANIERKDQDDQARLTYRGKPAVDIRLLRNANMDSIGSADILKQWLDTFRPTLPTGIKIHVYDQTWQLIKERISLLLTNGGGGLVLVVAILLLFLNNRVAFWVTVGIPVSFLAAMIVIFFIGGTINMISLFGLIMSLGIIVDDAIVVGENALAHYENGESASQAAEGGAKRMLAPVVSSSLTTIAAFLPLMLVGGIMGNIMFDIPLVVICVIIASLVECFLILPGHLRSAFSKIQPGNLQSRYAFTRRFDRSFEKFRQHTFRSIVTKAVKYRAITLATAVAVLIIAAGTVAGGRIGYTFFPNVEGRSIYASVAFTAGSPRQRVNAFLEHVEKALYLTEQQFDEPLVHTAISRHGLGRAVRHGLPRSGDQHGSLYVEMISSEKRSTNNKTFINAWKENITLPAGVEVFSISERRAGHPGRDVDVRLIGEDAQQLKMAALELTSVIKEMPGISAIEHDLPWGQEQLVFHLTAAGKSLGLNVDTIGRQLRAAYNGHLVQLFQDAQDEIEVRVMFPENEQNNLARLESLNIILPNGQNTPLASVIEISTQKGFAALRHSEAKLAVSVTADVDGSVNNNNKIRENLRNNILPKLSEKYNLTAKFQGRAEDQDATMADMKRGAIFAFFMIYIVLAWVFSSYAKPLVVMSVIPFGLVGAIAGHFLMDIELTVLSLFGFFGLSGIVVNDSIILVTFYQKLKASGLETLDAIVEATCQRLRAVLLTSLTTIAGLTPLLFETSLQAKFLIPMAVTISFGLFFSTFLVLLVIPALLSLLESTEIRTKILLTNNISN
jgi:multidrug efflux pump subunit AcrB